MTNYINKKIKSKDKISHNIFFITYFIIILGFILHTSSAKSFRIFNKYSLPYFIFLIFISFFGTGVYFYFPKLILWLRREYNITLINHTLTIKSIHKKISFIVFLLLSFLLIEAYFVNQELYLRIQMFHPFLQAKQLSSDKKIHINYFGFRGEEIKKDKPVGTIRIILLGGSSVFGDRTEYEFTHARLFEKALERKYPDKKIEVLNAGYHWYTTEHSLIDYLFRIRDFKPDILIMMHGINDLARSFNPPQFAFGEYKNDYSHYYGAVSNLVFSKGIFKCPLVISKMLQFLYYTFFSDFRNPSSIVAPRLKKIDIDKFPSLNAFERNIATFINITKSDGVTLIIVTQPTLYKDNLTEAEKRNIIFPGVFCSFRNSMPSILSMKKGMELFNLVLEKNAKEKNIYLIDLASIFPKKLDYFLDDCHYTKKGHNFITNVLYQFFIENSILENFNTDKFAINNP